MVNKILSFVLIIAAAAACRQKPKQVVVQHCVNTNVKTEVKPKPSNPRTGTIPNYTRSAYQQYITTQVQTLLTNLLPDWHMPDPAAWEKYWFDQYKSDTSLVNFARADFNGDHRPDYALILQSSQNKLAVWVFQSENNTYRPFKLTEMKTAKPPIQMGLELRRPGIFDYTDAETGRAKTMTSPYPAISVLWFETSSETFYWSNNRYRSVFTGD